MKNLSESDKLEKYLQEIDKENKFYIDIGASHISNISKNRIDDSDITIFCEYDASKTIIYNNLEWQIPNFHLISEKITPNNVTKLFKTITKRTNPKLLDLDIDGYDFYVLESFLNEYTPSFMICETNEKIPPPIRFAVKYTPEYSWDLSHFYGMSLSKLYDLIYDKYDLIDYVGNNAYLVLKTKNPGFKTYIPEEIYETYKNSWEFYFPYNKNMKKLLDLSPEDGLIFIDNFFQQYNEQYELYL